MDRVLRMPGGSCLVCCVWKSFHRLMYRYKDFPDESMKFLLFALSSLAVTVACPPCCNHSGCANKLPCPCLPSNDCHHRPKSTSTKRPAPPPCPPKPSCGSNCGKRCNERSCKICKPHKHDKYEGKDWFLPYTSHLQRFYSRKYQTHHYHTQPGPISRFLSDTFYGEGPPGRMITVDLYNQQKHELRRHCPFLVPLYTAINKKTKSQRMTTYVSELNVIMKSGQGWYKLEQVGYCVKGYKCGATKPLMEIRVKNKLSDVLYTSDMEEVGVVSKWKGWVLDTSPICYLW
ncbi:unnamed protein product [Cylicocyclus nassatus]|uniref:DUF5648 domain-containing protein n=1 Tax=Cylicocyclus nassatus TaxID=53992 RepID=A0AA36MCC6_CYLNA|nr:unnamed protein product [Cylicocyclus nassatus]